jgi:hypothetical protein
MFNNCSTGLFLVIENRNLAAQFLAIVVYDGDLSGMSFQDLWNVVTSRKVKLLNAPYFLLFKESSKLTTQFLACLLSASVFSNTSLKKLGTIDQDEGQYKQSRTVTLSRRTLIRCEESATPWF